jgi:hypothetical protein
VADERRMVTDDEAAYICRGMYEYLSSMDRYVEVDAGEIFGEHLFLFARKYGHIDGRIAARQAMNLTDADKRRIEEIWEEGEF